MVSLHAACPIAGTLTCIDNSGELGIPTLSSLFPQFTDSDGNNIFDILNPVYLLSFAMAFMGDYDVAASKPPGSCLGRGTSNPFGG